MATTWSAAPKSCGRREGTRETREAREAREPTLPAREPRATGERASGSEPSDSSEFHGDRPSSLRRVMIYCNTIYDK